MNSGAVIAISVVAGFIALVLLAGVVLVLVYPPRPPAYAPVFSNPNLTPYTPSWSSSTLTYEQAVSMCGNDPKCDVFQQITPTQAAWVQQQLPVVCAQPNPPKSCSPNIIAYTVQDKSKPVSVGNYGTSRLGPSVYAKPGVRLERVSPPPYAEIEDQRGVNKYSPSWWSSTLTYDQAVSKCNSDNKCDALMYVSPEQQAARTNNDPATCSNTPLPSYCVASVYPATVTDKTSPIIVTPSDYAKGPYLYLNSSVGYTTPVF